MIQSTSSLRRSEWFFFVLISSLVATVFMIAKFTSARSLERLRKWENKTVSSEIWIDLRGHVKRPGKYKLRPGDCLGVALRKAAPKPFADLSAIDLTFLPEQSMCIEIPEAKTIRIRVAGCVKEILDLEVEVGSRISDLKRKVELTSEADLKFFRKRRVLRENEVVEIPAHHNQLSLK